MKIQGGLGNQLFQYALGRHLALKNNIELKLDITWYAGQSYRKYELGQFNIRESIATSHEITHFKRYQKRGHPLLFLYNLFIADETKYIRERGYEFNPSILAVTDNAYLDGIWQSEKYFADIADTLKKEFTLKKPVTVEHSAIVQAMNSSNSVSICIRRGDFVQDTKVSTIHGALPLQYYYDAVQKIAELVDDPHFFVFSDDIAWVKDNFKLAYPVTYVSDGHTKVKSQEELVLMSSCAHVISANSTFSWWASWLNTHPKKITISPKTWFKSGYRNHPDLLLPSWITIDNTFQ